MFFDGFYAQGELASNDLIGIARDHQPHDVIFPLGERANLFGRSQLFVGEFLAPAAFRDVAADRLEFDELTLGTEQARCLQCSQTVRPSGKVVRCS